MLKVNVKDEVFLFEVVCVFFLFLNVANTYVVSSEYSFSFDELCCCLLVVISEHTGVKKVGEAMFKI